MYLQQSRIAVARAHSFYGNANVARGFGGNHYRELVNSYGRNCSPVPGVEREFSRSSIGLWQAAGELSPQVTSYAPDTSGNGIDESEMSPAAPWYLQLWIGCESVDQPNEQAATLVGSKFS